MFRRIAVHPVRPGGLALGLMVLLLFAYPSGLRSEDDPAPQVAKSLDPHLRSVLAVLLNRGAELYNGGDPDASCRLFESTLLVLRPALADRPWAQKTIDDGLAKARHKADARDRAFFLRTVLDAITSEVGPRKTDAPKTDIQKLTAEFTLSREEQAVLDLTNAERQKAGLAALKPNEKLFQAARGHSANMARQEVLAHTLDEQGPGERLRKAGYRASTWGENCAAGQRTPEEAVSSWMGSEGHRQNLLGQQFTEIGLGIAVSGSGTRYWTQVFGTPGGQ